jgi:KinB signaling pathway activation protein
MTIRKLFFLFWTTLLLGTVAAPLVGYTLQLFFGPIGIDWIRMLWAGVMFGAIAQMGFFAYMVFNMVGKGFIRNPILYQGLQLTLTILVLFNSYSVPLRRGGVETTSVGSHLVLPAILLIAALVVAWFKMKATNPYAFIPTVFFMVAATWLEALPSIEQESFEMIVFMVLTLLVCNTWQIMQLHRLVEVPDTSIRKQGDKKEKKKKS